MSIRLLSRDFAFYGVLDFIQRSLGILLVPIYTRVLTQSSYGSLDLILTVSSVLTVLIDLQFLAAFSRLYLENRQAGNGPRFVGTALLTRVTLGVIVVTLFLSLGFLGFLETSFMPSFLENRAAWTIASLTIPVTFAFDILIMQAQMLRSKKRFIAGALGNTLVSTTLCIGLTVGLGLGIVGVVTGQLIGLLTATIILLIALRDEVSFGYQKELLEAMSRYSLPLVPGRWMSHSTAYVSRFFVFASLGAAENAILAITMKLAAVVGLFSVAFRTAWQPLAMSYIGEEGGENFYGRSSRLLMAGGLGSVVLITVLARPALSVLAPDAYARAEYYLPTFLIATIVGELDANLQIANQIARKTHWISFASGVAFLINLIILATLTSPLGIHAAGLGLLLALVAKATVSYFSGQRNHKIRYDKRSFAVFAFGCLVLLLVSVSRSAQLISDAGFYAATVAIGVTMPWLTLAESDRQLLKVAAAGLGARFMARRPETRI
jgi:O-antigen/teichoic acid export membrane protein